VISTSPALFPAFSPWVTDYVSRCSASTPIQVFVNEPQGTTASVDGQPAQSGSFTAQVTRDVGQSFTIVVQEPSLQPASTYYVRCLPADFPTWTVQHPGPTQADGYVVAMADAKYPAIFDTNGVPLWWGIPPGPTAFAQFLPDGTFAWITAAGEADEVGLDGTIHTIRQAGSSSDDPTLRPGITDWHDLLKLSNGDYVLAVDTTRTGVDLEAAWGPGYPQSASVLDQVIEELTPAGHVVWSWDAMDHIPISETDPQWRNQVSNGSYDAYHWNSIEPTATGYLLSFRHLDAIYSIEAPTRGTSADGQTNSNTTITAADGAFTAADVGSAITDSLGDIPAGTTIAAYVSNTQVTLSQAATGTDTDDVFTIGGNILWKLGGSPHPGESLTVQNDPVVDAGGAVFSGQHDARQLADGTVTVHDDGTNTRSPRAVRYTIDPTNMTATWFGQVSDPLVTASVCCGSARKLSGGDWVMGWGASQTVTEMTPGGIRVFLLQFGSGILYRAIPVPAGQLDRAALRAGMDAQYSSSSAARTATQSQQWTPTTKVP
jgi:hypothetical protein